MNKFKKFVAAALASATMFATGITAFAEEQTLSDTSTVKLQKTYNLTGEGTSPEETFNFTVEKVSVTDAASTVTVENMPTFTVEGIYYSEGEAGGVNKTKTTAVTVPTYSSVGVYTYKITETEGENAKKGVSYDSTPVYMVVTVTNGTDGGFVRTVALHADSTTGDKLKDGDDAFENTYSAGKLTVEKIVTGNMADKSKAFKIKVTVKDTDGNEVSDLTKEFSLVNGDKTTGLIENIPYGYTYTVEEDDYTSEGYDDPVYSSKSGKIEAPKTELTVTNNKGKEIDTGINLTTLPYILVFAGVVAAGAYVVISRRNRFED